ncbi:hypothetical protein [Escherichia coli]|uniref:hypothetical protein n=1 Tax=Escherichia coli TaxID=562 RepID=UPI002100EC74|nr:hypothetical protein [Escherichia coli]MCQ1639677.1 hypothetical protein [Escherichia coli]
MKKKIIASAIALVTFSGVVNAAPNLNAGTLNLDFSGTVSTTTCALDPTVNGISGKNEIALGQTEKGTKGIEVDVVFKPTAASATACAGAASDFVMQWGGVGSNFESKKGLKAKDGSTASDAYVQIKAVNAKADGNNNLMADTDNFQYTFAKDKVSLAEGLKYKVNLLGGQTVGDMTATAQVNHWYK